MPTLLLRFPGGRYHATPWGHHVNEGLVEWPPSPWRLLRALIACGYSTQGWTDIPDEAIRLIESLADILPQYRLPPATLAHSRHFMPTTVFDKGREKTTLVFDAWADVGQGALAVRWHCDLDSDALSLFQVLAANLGYLGRSESWVEGESIPDDATLPAGTDAFPHAEGVHGGRGWEQVSLMAAESPSIYERWRGEAVAKTLESFTIPDGKKKASAKVEKERAAAVAPYPLDLLDALQRDTVWWKRHRWSQPPGSRRVLYWRNSDCLSAGAPLRVARQSQERVTTMLLALTTPSGVRAALPLVGRALPQGELLHRALIARVGQGRRIECPELTGKDENGGPLTGHGHAYLLSVDLDRDGHLDHILVHAPMGLGPNAQQSVRGLKRTWTKGGVGELQVALAGQGQIDDLRSISEPLAGGVVAVLGPSRGARIWKSYTPFVPPRFLKARGTNTLSGQVESELVSRGLPTASVEVLPWTESTRHLRHAIRVRRSPAKPPPIDSGFAIQLVFDVPVNGPIALGYGAHFGLGLFTAVTE